MNNLEFVHITKTAGTSIEQWGKDNNILWGYNNAEYYDNKIWQDIFKKNKYRGGQSWHIPPKFFIENPYKKKTFTVVRNPYTRIISEYYCPWLKPFHYDNDITDKNYFNQFIQNNLKDNFKNNKMLPHYLPQYLYIPIDYVLKFESLQIDFNNLIKKYDSKLDSKLPHINKGIYNLKKKFSSQDLYPETIKIINNVYDLDFKLFGYDKIK